MQEEFGHAADPAAMVFPTWSGANLKQDGIELSHVAFVETSCG
jgi:hypothetical protein